MKVQIVRRLKKGDQVGCLITKILNEKKTRQGVIYRYAMNKDMLFITKLIIRLSCFQFLKSKLGKHLQEILRIFHIGISTPLVIL